MTPEEYFFRYAFPCTEELLKRKRISEDAFNRLSNAANGLALGKKELPSRQEMEDAYKNAFKRMKRISKGGDCWSMDVVREYFLKEHNACIERGEDDYGNAAETFKDLCKVHEAGIIGFKQAVKIAGRDVDVYTVKYDGKERVVFNFYNLTNLNGKVRIHYSYIIEKV